MILFTGATGTLGRHVIQQLFQKIPANQIAAAVRDRGKAAASRSSASLPESYRECRSRVTKRCPADSKAWIESDSEAGGFPKPLREVRRRSLRRCSAI
jgi:nucleoside-diphosphate-sugar epimerase